MRNSLATRFWLTGVAALGSGFVLAAISASAAQPQSTEQSARQEFLKKLVAAAEERTTHTVRYDPAYVRIPYPGGDVPADTGVCTDEVIRSYRAVGVDLQKQVHEDMENNFSAYPRKWRWLTSHTDTNIDHRRVPNLMVFFSRKGETLAITPRAEDYSPGDLVTWDLGGGVPHIGIVVNEKSPEGRHLIVHNIGQGPKREDVLFRWKITGHYRYFGPPAVAASSARRPGLDSGRVPLTGLSAPPDSEGTPPSFLKVCLGLYHLVCFRGTRMTKVLYCHDLVPGCKFEARGESEEEILAEVADHIAVAHNMKDISDQILAMVCRAIREDVRVKGRGAGA